MSTLVRRNDRKQSRTGVSNVRLAILLAVVALLFYAGFFVVRALAGG